MVFTVPLCGYSVDKRRKRGSWQNFNRRFLSYRVKYYDSVIFFSKGSKLLGALFGDMKVFPRRIFENLDSLSRLSEITTDRRRIRF